MHHVILTHTKTNDEQYIAFPLTLDFSEFLKNIRAIQPDRNWKIDPDSTWES